MSVQSIFDIKTFFKTLADGDASGFEAFFNLYKKRVFGVALKMLKSETEAEEIVQDVFLSIWQSRAKLGEINDPEAYLFTITYNAVYAKLKKIAQNQQLLHSVVQHLVQKQNTTEETIAAHESERLINEAIQQLPAQQRTVYELNKLAGWSYYEIAEQLQLSQNTVRNHLSAATKTVRTILRKWTIPFLTGITVLAKNVLLSTHL